MKKMCLVVLSTLSLTACKPDVDVKLSTEDLIEVANTGASQLVSFDARIEEKYTTIDDEKRAEVKAISQIIETYFEDSEVDVTYGSSGFEIEIEGELELVSNGSSVKAPWYFSVSKGEDGQHLVSQKRSAVWDAFARELKGVSFMAAPKEFLPVNIKLKNEGGALYVGGAVLDGEFLPGFAEIALDGSRVNLNFDGDHWENAPAAFLFKEPEE